MSGIFGIVHKNEETVTTSWLAEAASKLSHRSWYKTDLWTTKNVGLGHIHIGIFNREPQPYRQGKWIVFFCGELYKLTDLYAVLTRAGITPADGSYAGLALSAYLAFGDSFASQLNGIFTVSIYDTENGRLLLTNDRFGMYPHYYWQRDQQLVFAPEVKAILAAPFVRRTLSMTALAEYVRFQQLLEDHTFHEDIFVFPPSSVGVFENGRLTITPYWDWNEIVYRPEISFEEAVEESGRLLRQSVERRSSDDLRPGVFLSGGLDSRTLLGLMEEREPAPVTATFGQRDSRDVHYAGEIARTMGTRHHWFDLPNGDWLLENLNLHLALTEGFHSFIHMHGISMLPTMREYMDYNLSGWEGSLIGWSVDISEVQHLMRPVDLTALMLYSYEDFTATGNYTWAGLNDAEERLLFSESLRGQMVGRAFESFAQVFKNYEHYQTEFIGEYLLIKNQYYRMTRNMNLTARSHLEVRFPLWDYDLLDFIFSLKPDYRAGKLLYRHIITRETPKLATIPYDKDEFLPTTNRRQKQIHDLGVRVRKKLKQFPQRPTLYADYANYLRGDLKNWAESILFDERTESRGIFDPAFVRSLWRRHQSGYDPDTLGRIAPFITLEMTLRAYMD